MPTRQDFLLVEQIETILGLECEDKSDEGIAAFIRLNLDKLYEYYDKETEELNDLL